MSRKSRESLWFVELTKDWGWLRRAWYVATWPIFYLWARLRMKLWRWWND